MLQELTSRSNTTTPDFAQIKSLLNLKSSAHVSMILTGKRRIANEQLDVLQKNIRLKPLELAYITAVVTLKSSFRRSQIINGLTRLLEKSEQISTSKTVLTTNQSNELYRGGFYTLEQDDYYIFNLRFHVFLSQIIQNFSHGEGNPKYLNVSLINFADNCCSMKDGISQNILHDKRKVEFKKFISGILIDVRNKNRSLSLRSIARKLGVSSAMLSLIVHGKRSMSDDLAMRFSEVTGIEDYAKEKLRLLAAYCRSASREEIIEHKSRLGMFPYFNEELKGESFWDEFWKLSLNPVLLAMENLDSYESNTSWIASKLKLSETEENLEQVREYLVKSELDKEEGGVSKDQVSLVYSLDRTPLSLGGWEQLLTAEDNPSTDGDVLYRIPVYTDQEKFSEIKKMIQQFLRGAESSFTTNVGQRCFHLNFAME